MFAVSKDGSQPLLSRDLWDWMLPHTF